MKAHINNKLKIIFLSVLLGVVLAFLLVRTLTSTAQPIKIGVLHSLTGTMATSEKPLVDAITLAVEEINARGGLLNRPIEIVLADGRSDPAFFAAEAERLINDEHVNVLFGCWTSACRMAVKKIVEKHQHLLFYPLQYEGVEQSPNIIYTGATPNQQIIPGVNWALEKFGRNVYLIGSDYVFPRMASLIIADIVNAQDGMVVHKHFVPLAGRDMTDAMKQISKQRPDVIFNTLNGDSNAAFFTALKQANLQHIPIVSFSLAEGEMSHWGGTQLEQHYAVWNYFQSLDTAQNQQFVRSFRQRFGSQRTLNAPMLASYAGVLLWAQAVRESGFVQPVRLQHSLLRQSLSTPAGVMAVDSASRHVWQTPLIGKVKSDGQFEVVWRSEQSVAPSPFPAYQQRDVWLSLLNLAIEGQP